MAGHTEALRCPTCDHREVGTVGARCPRDSSWLFVDEGPADPLLGTILDRRFAIVGLLGRGRSGRVYRAVQVSTGGEVAVKVLRPALARGAGLAERLMSSTRRLAQIDHPGVVVPFSIWSAEGRYCFAYQKVPGPSLSSLFGADPRRWVLVFAETLAAMNAAARHGVLHEHLTPEKVRVVDLPDGGVLPRILDFGLADIPLTVWHALGVLSPLARRFIPPELGEVEGDPRADTYGIGRLLWWVMTDGQPDDAERRAAAPAGLAAVADKAVSPDRLDRFPDAVTMRRALLDLLRTPEALWHTASPVGDAQALLVACTACAWALHSGGPVFDASVDTLVESLEAQGSLSPDRERVFRRLLARSGALLCAEPDDPPHIARICPACGAAHSVRIDGVATVQHCVTCGFRLPDSKLDAVVAQREGPTGPAAFDPATGALLVEPRAVTVRLESAQQGHPLSQAGAAFHVASTLDGPPRVTVSPRHPPALAAGFVRCAPADAPGVPDRTPRPLVEPGHVAEIELAGWPPAFRDREALEYAVTYEGRGARRVLRTFTVRRLPRVRASVVFSGDAPREIGDTLLSVARGAPFTLSLVADATLPVLDSIDITLDGPDGRWTVPLEVKTVDRRQTGVMPRIPARPALQFTGLVPRDLPVGRDVRATLTARFERTLGAMRLVGRWRIMPALSGTEAPVPTLNLTASGLAPITLAYDQPVPLELTGDVGRELGLEIRARDMFPGTELRLKVDGGHIDERLTCVQRDEDDSLWQGRVTFDAAAPGSMAVLLEVGRQRTVFPVTINAPPRVEATIIWDRREDMPFVSLLGPDRPIAAARPWPGAREARVHLRAIGYPIDVEVVDAPLVGPPTNLGRLQLTPDRHQAVTLDIGGELRLRVDGVVGGAPSVYIVRLAAPVTDVQPLQLVEGEVIAIDRVVAGQVETRVVHLSNALPEPIDLAAVEADGLSWVGVVRPEADGGGSVHSDRPLRLRASGQTPLILHIAPPAHLPASDDPLEGALLLWVPGLAAPVRLPVIIGRVDAMATLPGPLALDLGALRIVARVPTPQGPQTWRGRLGHDAAGAIDPERGVRAIAKRLGHSLGMRPERVQLVCPTSASMTDRNGLARMVTEAFGGVEVDITLDQATASALGALEAHIRDNPEDTAIELLSVDIGARTTDVARIQAAVGPDGRWQGWIRRRAVSSRAGAGFTRLLADAVLRPAVAEALTALATERSKKASWYARASTGKKRTGNMGGWYARARAGGRRLELASAAEYPGDLRVARSDRAVERIAEEAKRRFADAGALRLDALEPFAAALDDILVATPEGLKALTPEARARLAEVEVRRDDFEPVVRAALEALFTRISGLIEDGGAELVVLCGFSVHLPACLEAAQTAFHQVRLRIVPESLAVRGAYWIASGRAGVRWIGEPISLDD